MITKQSVIFNILNNNVAINRQFSDKYLQPNVLLKDTKYPKYSWDNNIHDITDKVNKITKCFNYRMNQCAIKTKIVNMISFISNVFESDEQYHMDILLERFSGNSNGHRIYFRSMFNLINIRLFIYIINYLKIDERDIFKRYGILGLYLEDAILQCKQRLSSTTEIFDIYIIITKAEIDNVIDDIIYDIEILAEVSHKKRLLWPEYLQHYSQIKRFNLSPSLDKFTDLRFL